MIPLTHHASSPLNAPPAPSPSQIQSNYLSLKCGGYSSNLLISAIILVTSFFYSQYGLVSLHASFSSKQSRLLWVTPRSDGFNNQLITLYRAMRCANMLNRTLVLPFFYENVRYDTNRAGPFPFRDYFNTSALSTVVNFISPTVLHEHGLNCKVIYYRTPEGKVPILLRHYRGTLRIPVTFRFTKRKNVKDYALLAPCIHDTLCGPEFTDLGLYSDYNTTGQGFDARTSIEFRNLRAALKPTQAIEKLASWWRSQLPPRFNSMHVRRGDYAQKCKSMKVECKVFGADAFYQSETRLRGAIMEFNDPSLPIFVSSTHDAECRRMLIGIRVDLWFMSNLSLPDDMVWASNRTDVLSLASQILSSRAESFIGNRFSSYTTEINNMRLLRNRSSVLKFF